MQYYALSLAPLSAWKPLLLILHEIPTSPTHPSRPVPNVVCFTN